jgi:hypothetical protein
MATVYVNTVYWEGGETYRPFVTVSAPKKWPVKKMAFYRSTGSSNDDENNEYREGTWFPTLGLLPQDSTLYNDLIMGEDGHKYTPDCILKRSVFSKIFKQYLTNWDVNVVREMTYNVKANVYYKIPEYLKSKMSSGKKIEDEVKKVTLFCGVLAYYCQYWWQVQISARLGEGYWENVPEFKEFVLSYDYDDYIGKNNTLFTKRLTPLSMINIEYNVDVNRKDDAIKVMDVLKKEDAIIMELLYGDYKEHKMKLLNIFVKGVSLSKQRKSKSKSPITETKKRKRKSKSKSKSPIKKSTRKRV